MFQAIIALIRIAGLLMHRASFNEGMRAQIAKELNELNGRLEKTRKIVDLINAQTEDEIDKELRG